MIFFVSAPLRFFLSRHHLLEVTLFHWMNIENWYAGSIGTMDDLHVQHVSLFSAEKCFN